jgi:hypothetical protein
VVTPTSTATPATTASTAQVEAGDGGSCYTAMLYDGGVTSHAYGTEDNGFNTGAG